MAKGGERLGWDGLRELPLLSADWFLGVLFGLPIRTDESMIHVAPAFWHLSQGALGLALRMHLSFWPRHLSHASCWGFSLLEGFSNPDPNSNPEKQLEASGRAMLGH